MKVFAGHTQAATGKAGLRIYSAGVCTDSCLHFSSLESWGLKATIWLSLVPEKHVARTCVTHIFLWTTLSLHLFIVGEGLEKSLTHRQEQNI